MKEIERTKLKDWLIIIATTINILLGVGVIFGGMEWITGVNSTLAVTTGTLEKVVVKVEETVKWEQNHDLKHATKP